MRATFDPALEVRIVERYPLDGGASRVGASVPLGEAVIGFGTGSSPTLERLEIVRGDSVAVADASGLYALLHREIRELHVACAAVVDDRLRLFHRIGATADFTLASFIHYLAGGPLPELLGVTRWELDGAPLVFFDAATRDGRVFFLAAEPPAGVALGVIEAGGARMAPISGLDRAPHGLAFDAGNRGSFVVDRGGAAAPAELCRFELAGPW